MIIDKRVNILKASLKLFVSQGVHTVTIAQIGKEANVGIGTIYKHFKDKEDIMQQIWIEQKKWEAEYVFGNFKNNGSVEERFRILWEKVIRYFIENPLEFQFSYYFAASPILTEEIHNIAMKDFLVFDKIFQEGIDQDLFKPLQAHHLRLFTFSTINGWILWAMDENIKFTNQKIALFLDMAWDAIKK